MNLTEIEKRSALWLKMSEHYTSRLAELRLLNDGEKNEAETAKLRGRIAEVKQLLALAEADPGFEG